MEGHDDQDMDVAGTNVQSIVLLYCPDSLASKAVIKYISSLRSKPNIQTCDVSGMSARKILAGNNIAKIIGVPTMLVIKADGQADIFNGGAKIVQWLSDFANDAQSIEEEDEENQTQVPIQPPPTATEGGGLRFEFVGGKNQRGPPQRMAPPLDPTVAKHKDVMRMAKKMEADRLQTLGYNEGPSSDPGSSHHPDHEPV